MVSMAGDGLLRSSPSHRPKEMTFFKASWLLALALRDDHQVKFQVIYQTKGSKKRWESPMGNIQNIAKTMENHHFQLGKSTISMVISNGNLQWKSPMDKQIVDPL